MLPAPSFVTEKPFVWAPPMAVPSVAMNFVSLSWGSKPVPTAPMAMPNEPWCITDIRTPALRCVAGSASAKVARRLPVRNCTILSRAAAGSRVLTFLPPSEMPIPRAKSTEKEWKCLFPAIWSAMRVVVPALPCRLMRPWNVSRGFATFERPLSLATMEAIWPAAPPVMPNCLAKAFSSASTALLTARMRRAVSGLPWP